MKKVLDVKVPTEVTMYFIATSYMLWQLFAHFVPLPQLGPPATAWRNLTSETV